MHMRVWMMALTLAKDRGVHLDTSFGPDDRVFMLRRAPARDCADIEEAVTEPEPGVPRRTR